jgi:RNA polymerase-binding protein DksA
MFGLKKKSKPDNTAADAANNDNELDRASIEIIKKDLLSRKKQIEIDLKDMTTDENGEEGGAQKVKFPDYGDKIDENAQEIGEYTTNLATEKVLESALRDINNALDRIEKGTYGICRYCHKKIGKKRLLARPVASACVECKTRLQNAA